MVAPGAMEPHTSMSSMTSPSALGSAPGELLASVDADCDHSRPGHPRLCEIRVQVRVTETAAQFDDGDRLPGTRQVLGERIELRDLRRPQGRALLATEFATSREGAIAGEGRSASSIVSPVL